MIRKAPPRKWVAGTLCLAAFGCSTASFQMAADREVGEILRVGMDKELGRREQEVLLPEFTEGQAAGTGDPFAAPEEGAPDPMEQDPVPEGPLAAESTEYLGLDLDAVLKIAVKQNREYLVRRESMYREGLSISLARFQFGPQFQSAVSFLWPRGEDGVNSRSAGANFSVSQILPTGGTVSLSTGLNGDWPNNRGVINDPSFGSSVGVSVSQPLLRGAGYRVSHEPLTSAERGFVYAIRDFELFRQDFTIRIAQQFFQLISERKQLANQDANYDAAVFDRKKAQALIKADRNTEQEVFLARRREIVAKDNLINARANYERQVDSFKIELGIPTTTPLELVDIEPPYKPIQFEVSSAIEAALHNRLDLITQRQQVEDEERRLKNAENNLLPDLNLTADYGFTGAGDTLNRAMPETWDASIGLTFDLPLQRKPERNSYRSQMISLVQAKRALSLREDQLKLQIRNAVRQLRSIEERIVLQEAQIKQEQRVVTVTQIRFESGKVDNRNLLDARQAFVDAQNALINLKVDHFVARLNLLRDMGVLFIDEDGMWREVLTR